MKKLVSILIACVVGSFTFGCSSNAIQEEKIVSQPSLSLVSPEGTRIANSLDELASLPFTKDRPVTITKIDYRQPFAFMTSTRPDERTATQAIVHYRSAEGKLGQFIIEMPKS